MGTMADTLAHGLNLVNSPTQTQGSDVNTNIKGNNNHVTNVINQNQAANSGNGGDNVAVAATYRLVGSYVR